MAVPTPPRRVWSYLVPRGSEGRVQPGCRVRVPFAGRSLVGVVVGVREASALDLAPRAAKAGEKGGHGASGADAGGGGEPRTASGAGGGKRGTPGLFDAVEGGDLEADATSAPEPALKEIASLLDLTPAVPPVLLELTRFLGEYYRCSWGEALEAALPGAVKRRNRAKGRGARLAEGLPEERPGGGAGEGAGGSAGTVAGSDAGSDAGSGASDAGSGASDGAPGSTQDPAGARLALTAGQEEALAIARASIRERRFETLLVHGVTGSGKTEVYLRAIEEALALGRSAILLVPEIALTPQTLARVTARFGAGAAVLHSLQGDAERVAAWERVRRGSAKVVLGPRSAVFAPAVNVGLIVVDEEHEGSFKQDMPPRYHARDLAIVRGRIEGATVLLGSATPSLESWHAAREGRYRGVFLPERATQAQLPPVEVVDLNQECREVEGFPFISRRLESALADALSRKEQAILFLNRRGFATFLQCRGCKHVLTCASCDIALTYHKASHRAECHACESSREPPRQCPKCLGHDVKYFGFGTERIEEEVRRKLPDARVLRLDSDAVLDATHLEAALARFGAREADILVGTQMVAKGLDFPHVTVVGVISADTALNLPDFRAAERTFQLLAQVAGRAGRAGLAGVSIIQTFCPHHPAVKAATTHDALGFLADEALHRKALCYPPFGRLVRVVVSGEDEGETIRAAETLAHHVRLAFPSGPDAPAPPVMLGPAPAPIAMLHARHRIHFVLKAKDRPSLRSSLAALDAPPRLPASVRVAVDVDPVALL